MPDTMLAQHCPHCGFQLDPRGWDERKPETGDLTICQGCAHVLRFGKLLGLNAMTPRDERNLLRVFPNIKNQCRQVAQRLLFGQRHPS